MGRAAGQPACQHAPGGGPRLLGQGRHQAAHRRGRAERRDDRRSREDPNADPLDPLRDALKNGFSLIIFPEGTRAPQPLPGPFKGGLYFLAQEFPQVELIPVYLDNLHRSLPKGALLPVPIISTVRFGAPLARAEGESKDAFLSRARAAVIELASG